MMKKWLLYIMFFSIVPFVKAQNNFQLQKSNKGKKGLIYNKEKVVLIEGKTNGLDVGYQWGELKTYYRTTFYRLNLGFLRHSKETRINPLGVTTPTTNSYYYGKRNSFWQLKAGWGEKRYLSEKDGIRGVAVGYSYNFGPSLGLLKPYYLQKGTNGNDTRLNQNYIKYSVETEKDFLSKNRISGAAPFFTGIDEIKTQIGGHINWGLHLDWGAYEDFVRSLEVGIAADIYLRKVPIMVFDAENRNYFFNLYAHFQLGRRK
jgi:hypothetical protein